MHWEQIGNVLDRPSQLPLPLPGSKASGGLYAPTIRHHDGLFWVVNTNVDGGGNFVVRAERPEGPWSDPVWIDVEGIDPDLAWEEDGTCWCAFSGPAGGINLARIDPVEGTVLEGPFPTWSGSGLSTPRRRTSSAPGDWWYLLIAEGGTERGHAVSVARARSPRGPWEGAPGNPCCRTAAPAARSRTPATPTWSKRPTAAGGWCCSASARAGSRPTCTSWAGRRS